MSYVIDGWASTDVSLIGGEAGALGSAKLFYEGRIVKVEGSLSTLRMRDDWGGGISGGRIWKSLIGTSYLWDFVGNNLL